MNVLLVIDPQNDFISGSLKVEGANAAMCTLASNLAKGKFPDIERIVITCDCHPVNHCSFKENGGVWNPHCIDNSEGAAIPEYLFSAIRKATNHVYIWRKGEDPYVDNYSIVEALRKVYDCNAEAFIDAFYTHDKVYVVGIAGDYCVLETIKDLKRIHNKLVVVFDCTASIDGGNKLREYCKENNVELIDSI